MIDLAIKTTLLRNADRLTLKRTLFSEHELVAASMAELKAPRVAGAFIGVIDELVEAGYLRHSLNFPGFMRTDRADRWMDRFARIVSDPTHTNPRISLAQNRQRGRDHSHPFDQPQRFTILDARPGEDIEAVLTRLDLRGRLASAHHVYGDEGAEIGRFAIDTPNLVKAGDFVALAGEAMDRVTPAGVGYSADRVVVISDAALRSAHRAFMIAASAEYLGAGKVLLILERGRTPAQDLMPIRAAIRAGAACAWGVASSFTDVTWPVSLAATLSPFRARFTVPVDESLARAAARAAFWTEGRCLLVSSDPVRLPNLNKAARSLAIDPASFAATVCLDTLEPIRADLYEIRVGCGLRDGDVLRVEAARATSEHAVGDRFLVKAHNAMENTVTAKSPSGRYVRLTLRELADRGVRLAAYSPSTITVREGEPISIELDPGRRVEGRAMVSTAAESIFAPAGGGRPHLMTSAELASCNARFEYARASLDDRATDAVIAVSGIHDRSPSGSFCPGGAYAAVRWADANRGGTVEIFTDDVDRFLEHSKYVDSDCAERLVASCKFTGAKLRTVTP